MKIKIVLLVFFGLFYSQMLIAQQRIVYECGSRHSINDIVLQQAIEATAASNPSIEFQTEDKPCSHQHYIANAFSRTFNRNFMSLASGYSFALMKNADNRFSVERFVFKNAHAAEAIGNVMRQLKINILQIESLTYYDLFVSDDNLIVFVADRQSFNESQALFKMIKDNFLLKQGQPGKGD